MAIFFALVFSQMPSFTQQYHQRLAGRLDLALQREAEITTDALSMNLPVATYIQRFLDSPDHVLEGRRMEASLTLARQLSQQEEALRQALPVTAPLRLVAQYDSALAVDVFHLYRPALPLDLAGLVYTLFGTLLGYFGLTGIFWCIGARRRAAKPSETGQ